MFRINFTNAVGDKNERRQAGSIAELVRALQYPPSFSDTAIIEGSREDDLLLFKRIDTAWISCIGVKG